MPQILLQPKHKSAAFAASREFVELVKGYRTSGGSLPVIRKALAAHCSKYPDWYRQWIEKEVGVELLKSTTPLTIAQEVLHKSIEEFGERLQAHPYKTFILNDAKLFLGGSPAMEEDYYIFHLLPSSVGSVESYLLLLQIANRAVLNSHDNWETFRAQYHKEFTQLLRTHQDIRALAVSVGEEARLLMKGHTAAKIVAPGPQGTLSLFLMESLRLRAPQMETDTMLFAVYPWLKTLFEGRYQTIDPAALNVIEQNVQRMRHSMDPLEKTSGALVGFAVGDALGAPAAGILKEDFFRLKGSEILHFTTNSQHPYYYHLAAGSTSDITRTLLQTAQDLVHDRGYNQSTRIHSLGQWAMRCQREPGFARWPGKTTFHAAIQLANGVSPKRAAYTQVNSWGATPRSLAIGLIYTQEKEIVRFCKQETALTHNAPASICGATYLALLISFLVSEMNPYSAAERALTVVQQEYRKTIPSTFVRAIRLAMHTTIEPHEAPAVFGTGSPVEQCMPLALYYFLRYPSHFRTPVQLAANSYRVDTVQERGRLKMYNWSEQVLYCAGGNTGGVASMVGALIGAHNGLKIIDEQFVSVEDFDHIVRIARQLESLRLKRQSSR